MSSTQRTEKILITGLFLIIAAVAGIVIILTRQAGTLKESARDVQRSNELLTKTQNLLVDVINIESGTRGFVLTGDDKFLEPFKISQPRAEEALAELKNFLTQRSAQRSLGDSVTFYIRQRLKFSTEQIALRRSLGLKAAAADVAEGTAKQYVDKLREMIGRFEAQERQLLDQQKNRNNTELYRLNRILFILLGLVVLLILFLSVYAWHGFVQQKRRQKEVVNFNETLSREVNRQTVELTTTFERITDGFIALDKNWRFTYLNKRAGELFMRDPQELIGKNIWDETPVEEGRAFKEAYLRAMETQTYIYLQEHYAPFNRWFENHIYPSVDGVSVFLRDITGVKEAELQLKREASRRNLLLDNAFDGILVLDESFKVVECNQTFAVMLGRSISDSIGTYVWEWDVVYNTKEKLLKIWPELPTTRQKFDAKIMCKDGKVIDVEIAGSPEITDKDDQRLMLFVCRDVTENRIAREKLEEQEQQLRLFVENSPAAIAMLDKNMCYIVASKRWATDYGISHEDLIGKNHYSVFPDEPEKWKEVHQRCLAGQSEKKEEDCFVRKDGTKLWVRWEVHPWQKKNGETGGIILLTEVITERKLSEQIIKESEEKYRTLVEQASDAIFISNLEGKLIAVNSSAAKLSKYSEKELLNMSIYDFAVPEDIQKNPFHFAELKQGKTVTTQRVVKDRDGKLKDVEVTAKLLPDGRLLIFVRDISDRIKAQSLIIAEKNLSDTIINSLPGVFYLYTQEGKFLRWNRNFEVVTGYNAEEMQQSHPLDFFTEKDKQLLTEKIGNVFVTGEDSVVAEFLLKSGKTIPYYFTGRTIEYENQLCLMGVGIDISERKKIEDKLRESENKYRMLFEDNPLPLWIYSLESLRFLEVNDAAIKHYGFTREEFLNMTLLDIRPPEDVEALLIAEKKDYRGIYHAGTWRHIKKDGKVIQVQIVTHDTLFEGEHVRLVLANDVTEKAEAETKLVESLGALRRLSAHLQYIREEERKGIGREIHDELGQQLTAIKMDVAWIDKRIDETETTLKAKLKNTINLLDTSNRSLRKILNELRSDIIDSRSLIDALDMLGEQFKANAGVQFSLKTSEPDIIAEAPIANCLYRILQEALTNITKYANATAVEVKLLKEENSISLSIADNGAGFLPSMKNKPEAFGIIGMKERVASLKGSFELQTEPGNGTLIKVVLPIRTENKKS